MVHPKRTLTLLLAAVAVLAAPPGAAQSTVSASGVEETNTAYYAFLRTGEVPVEVFVLGEVRAPGVYAVGLGTDLDHLLALAGGVAYGSSEEDLERDVTVRLYHQAGGSRTLAYEQSLDRVLAGAPPLPALEDGDVVVVDAEAQQEWLTFDNALRVFTALASLFLIIESASQ
jgi:hypothetical protein